MRTVPALPAHPRWRPARLVTVGLVLVAACALVLLSVPADVPPDVVWLPADNGDGGVAASPGGPTGAWELVSPWPSPDDSYWEAISIVPSRSAFARLRARIAASVGLDAAPDGWLCWRCIPGGAEGSAAYAFTGLTESEAAEIVVGATDARVLRDRARAHVGAARFDALSSGRPDPGPAAR